MRRSDVRREEGDAGPDRALVAALNQSARWNESQLVLGGCTFLAQAWGAVVQVRAQSLQAWGPAMPHQNSAHPYATIRIFPMEPHGVAVAFLDRSRIPRGAEDPSRGR